MLSQQLGLHCSYCTIVRLHSSSLFIPTNTAGLQAQSSFVPAGDHLDENIRWHWHKPYHFRARVFPAMKVLFYLTDYLKLIFQRITALQNIKAFYTLVKMHNAKFFRTGWRRWSGNRFLFKRVTISLLVRAWLLPNDGIKAHHAHIDQPSAKMINFYGNFKYFHA